MSFDIKFKAMTIKYILEKCCIFILDLLFPIECVGCGEEGEWICRKCLATIKSAEENYCPICGREGKTSKICFDCRNKSYLSGLIVGAPYSNALARKAIHLFKYRFLSDLADPLAEILIGRFKNFNDLENFIIVPVPLHKKRLKWRGFNQAELLASALARHYGAFLANDALIRIKNTIPQVEVADRRKRIDNIKNAFVVANPESVKDKKIILTDDVATTMATLDECARVLRLAGAREVWGAVAARG